MTLRACPSVYTLEAATRVVRIVSDDIQSRPALWASYQATASGGRLPVRQLTRAEEWLSEIGWLEIANGSVRFVADDSLLDATDAEIGRELLRSWIDLARPGWLRAAFSKGELRTELVPSEVIGVLDSVCDEDDRDVILITCATKVDADTRALLGELGEETVVEEWTSSLQRHGAENLVSAVRRVSLISDSYGYDVVAPDLDGKRHYLEVKCFRGRVANCFISRNEYEVGIRLPTWRLVICRATSESKAQIVGWASADLLQHRVPVDRDAHGSWQSARITFRRGDLTPGLPLMSM